MGCKGCKYWRRLYETGGNNYACHYYLDTGKLRGGTVEDCTVREAGGRKKKRCERREDNANVQIY